MLEHDTGKPEGLIKTKVRSFIHLVQSVLAALIFVFGCYLSVKVMTKEREAYEPVSKHELSQMQPISGDISDFHDQCDCVITKLTRNVRYVNKIPEVTWFVQTRPGKSLIHIYHFGGTAGQVNMFGEMGAMKRWVAQDFPRGVLESAYIAYAGSRQPYPSWAVVSVSLPPDS